MAVNKIDPKVIFASEAPAQDTPAVFTNRTVGWGETRKNGGRPTIKQMNAEQQSTDLKILWLNENAVTPFDATIDYPVDAVTIKDGLFKIFDGSVWNLFLDKADIGLGNVDNTSDLNKPISTSTQTALDLKADKSYVDTSLPHNNLINRNSSGAHEAVAIVNSSGENQQQINDRGGATWYEKTGGYALNDRVILSNGDEVRSTIANNTVDPNVDMTGWVLELTKLMFMDYTLLRGYKGGGVTVEIVGVGIAGHFVLDVNDTTSADNGGTIIVDILGRRWKRNSPLGYYDVTWFGAVAGFTVDNTDAIQRAFDASKTQSATITGGIIKFPRGNYVISDTIRVRTDSNEKLASVTIVGDGMQNTTLYWNTPEITDKDVLVFEEINYCGMQDICVQGNKKARHGVVFRSTRINCQLVIDRVQSRDVLSNCYDFQGQFMTTIRHCRAKNGDNGYRFRGNHTSCYFENAYALDNTSAGFYIESMTYSVFNACASDSNLYGYRMNNINGVVMNGCGAEYNKQSGWYLVASAELDSTFTYKGLSMQLNNCVGYDNDRSLSGYGTLRVEQRNTSYVSLTVNQFYEIMVNSSVSVYTAGSYTNCTVDLNKCRFTKAIHGENGSQGVFSNPVGTFKKSATFTALTPANIFSLSSGASNTNTYSAMLFVRAASARPASTLYATNTATYLLMVTKTPLSSDVSVKLISQDGMTTGGGTTRPSFTFGGQGNNLVATPIDTAAGEFFFDVYSLGQINLV